MSVEGGAAVLLRAPERRELVDFGLNLKTPDRPFFSFERKKNLASKKIYWFAP